MIFRLAPRQFCLLVHAEKSSVWTRDPRLDFRRLGLAIQFIDRCNADVYRGYNPGELCCVEFDVLAGGQPVIVFEETYSMAKASQADCVPFAKLPAGRWQQISTDHAKTVEKYR